MTSRTISKRRRMRKAATRPRFFFFSSSRERSSSLGSSTRPPPHLFSPLLFSLFSLPSSFRKKKGHRLAALADQGDQRVCQGPELVCRARYGVEGETARESVFLFLSSSCRTPSPPRLTFSPSLFSPSLSEPSLFRRTLSSPFPSPWPGGTSMSSRPCAKGCGSSSPRRCSATPGGLAATAPRRRRRGRGRRKGGRQGGLRGLQRTHGIAAGPTSSRWSSTASTGGRRCRRPATWATGSKPAPRSTAST